MARNLSTLPRDEPDDRPPMAYGVPKLRGQVLQRLATAYAEDNLELAEYERRVQAAQAATTIAQLRALMADFPEGRSTPSHLPSGPPSGSDEIVTFMGKRHLAVLSDRDLPRRVVNVMGETRIDLSEVPPGVYELRVCNIMGELQVAVPPGTHVPRTLRNLLSEVSMRAWKTTRSAVAQNTSHRVILTGFSLMGEVTVREESS